MSYIRPKGHLCTHIVVPWDVPNYLRTSCDIPHLDQWDVPTFILWSHGMSQFTIGQVGMSHWTNGITQLFPSSPVECCKATWDMFQHPTLDQWDIPALILWFYGKSQITSGQVGTSPLDQWDSPTIPKHSSEMSYIKPMAHPHHLYGGFLASIR